VATALTVRDSLDVLDSTDSKKNAQPVRDAGRAPNADDVPCPRLESEELNVFTGRRPARPVLG